MEMNMHAELKRNQCLQSMRVDSPGSIIAGFFVFYCSSYPPARQNDVSSFFAVIYMSCINSWPVSLLWAAQLLMFNGSVSHYG